MRGITQERLRELLTYDPTTGLFRWLVNRRGGPRAGDVAGSINKVLGYRIIGIDGELYYGHILAWFWLNGEWPDREIDHENLDRADNSEKNLRLADRSQQRGNQKVRRDSQSGVKGVCRVPSGRYRAHSVHGHIGTYDTIEEASAAYHAFAERHFGEYART